MERNEYKAEIREKLAKLIDAFCPILYEDDEIFLKNMEGRNLAGDDVRALLRPGEALHDPPGALPARGQVLLLQQVFSHVGHGEKGGDWSPAPPP